MLTLLTTTEHTESVRAAIESIERLDELITVVEVPSAEGISYPLMIEDSLIKTSLDWFDFGPPYIIPAVEFTEGNLLALVFFKIGNDQRAFDFITEDSLLFKHLFILYHLQHGYQVSDEILQFLAATSLHNLAIVQQFGNTERRLETTELNNLYARAITAGENEEVQAYTAKYYCSFLIERNMPIEAKEVAHTYQNQGLSEEGKHSLNVELAASLMCQLEVPYQLEELDTLLALQQANIEFCESNGLPVSAGMLLVDAAEVANFKKDFTTSMALINRAVKYFKSEDVPEFLGEAGYKKAILLYTWSKNGSPQYYKASINAFQDVLKVFKRDTHPKKFADIHHNLALIYSEIPVSSEEKPIWTAFSASSFKEVLAFYSKEEYPYENAMASHNYATALMHFPPAKLHDNLSKATGLFEQALETRTAVEYPIERALTLLNLLELNWLSHNEEGISSMLKVAEMEERAKEVKDLITDKDLIDLAEGHLNQLENLRTVL